jgi:adenylate cyclase
MNRSNDRDPATIDPYPRQYPTLVTLIRRANRGAASVTGDSTVDEIRAWLLSTAISEKDLLPLIEDLVWRMVAAGLPVDRMTLHVGTLHPQLVGFYWHWDREDGLVDELKVDQSGMITERYRRSPLSVVIEGGKSFRAESFDDEMLVRYPILQDLKAQGIRDYAVIPMGARGEYHNAATIATRCDCGFRDEDMENFGRILELFALHAERHIAWRIAENVVETYLGTVPGQRVLSGAIQRGAGESIHAVIWMSDLRGFTNLVDRLPPQDVLAVLNEYFERITEAIIANGGEILKFIGDGVLSMFPVDDKSGEASAAAASIAAAELAMKKIYQLNEHATDSLRQISGWKPLQSGIALHLGEIFFGNVGAPERLDFTVIGRAVNEVSRVETLTKELNRSILITEPVANLLDRDLENMGSHQLRGLSGYITLYSV